MIFELLMPYILLIVGLLFLIKGGNYLVDGGASIAKRFNISNIVIGLTIVAFGTSAPELIVNIIASINGNSDIAVGNIVGSNIVNILLILGITALIYPVSVKKGTTWKEIPFTLLAVIVLGIIANDMFLDGYSFSIISRGDGLVLFLFFIIFMYYTFGISKAEGEGDNVKQFGKAMSFGMVIGGLVALTLGGRWFVDGATQLARLWGVSEAMIGLTVIAVGTSLPEFATSVIAALKKNSDIAVGNIVGSNIFNIFWILGVSALINPINYSLALNFDLIVLVITTTLLFIFMFIGTKHRLDRWQGVIFIALYVLYIILLIVRG